MRFLLIVALIAAGLCFAQPPAYQAFYYQECAGSYIDVGYYGAPCVANWDDDDNKDLILGVYSYGNIRFYSNVNNNNSPIFNNYTNLKADGVTITLPAS